MALKKVTPEDWSKTDSPSDRKHYPSFTLKIKDIPEADNWEVGKKYKLVIEVEMTNMNKRRNEKADVGFDVKAVAPIKDNPEKEYAEIVKKGK